MMDAYRYARSSHNRSTSANGGSAPLDIGIVAYTRFKLADMRLSILYSYDAIDEFSMLEAHRRATLCCGAYMAHAKVDMSFDDIRHVLHRAGGDSEAIANCDEHLYGWRFRGGHTEEEYAKLQRNKKEGKL
jgi:hypothetical protein